MKATEKREVTQVFELDKGEVIECIKDYLQKKGQAVVAKAEVHLEMKVHPTIRDVEVLKVTIHQVEEGPAGNGKEAKSENQ